MQFSPFAQNMFNYFDNKIHLNSNTYTLGTLLYLFQISNNYLLELFTMTGTSNNYDKYQIYLIIKYVMYTMVNLIMFVKQCFQNKDIIVKGGDGIINFYYLSEIVGDIEDKTILNKNYSKVIRRSSTVFISYLTPSVRSKTMYPPYLHSYLNYIIIISYFE